ncbi:MAG TPA: polyribonucleotide nucleotidyltransferase [Actinomycetes bacterium]|nr:polyribonucleotide nucleotidyltransferase [Actinomycetes bacterium]
MAVHRVQGAVGGRDMFLETGKLAKLAGGSVVVGLGGTWLLVTATAAKQAKEQLDFFPLTVDVEERMYAAGKIPGGFFRREGRPSETAILTARLVDRPLRPSFPKGLRNEVHVVATVLSADMQNLWDVLAINGASTAVQLAGIPFSGPVGAVRLGRKETDWIVNPTYDELAECTYDMVVAGRQNEAGGVDVLMVEAEATEHAVRLMEEGAPKPTEEALGLALELSKPHIATACQLQLELVRQAGAQPREFPLFAEYGEDVAGVVRAAAEAAVREAITIADKNERQDRLDELKAQALQAAAEQLGDALAGREKEVSAAFRALTKELVRQRVVKDGKRIDGRGPRDIRPLEAEVGILPRAHGSGLFQRGETQVLNVTTLGMVRMEQIVDTLDPEERKRFMHHYNFPPFSTGETGFMRGPKRREIGHGALAERAVLPVVPDKEEFPYALRLVSEVLSSNGSTSMASVCASTLSLMDAGVPIKAPVGGIAMGLIAEGGEFVTLTDILGAEDAFGDMDFKVAGTREFVTALQLDTKLAGIPSEVLIGALTQARDARLVVLDVIQAAIDRPREELNRLAPRVHVEQIPVAKIGELIGPKGKRINEIQAASGADISIEDDGRVFIGATDGEQLDIALRMIREQMNPVMPQTGERYLGTVVKTTTFGAFISLTPGKDGLLHISKLGRKGQRVRAVEDVVNVGDKLLVEVVEVDRQNRISLKLAEEGEAAPGSTDGVTASPAASGSASADGESQ